MRFLLVGLTCLSLSGCDRSKGETEERAEVADVNARNALALVQELEDRIGTLESRVSELENR